MSNHRRRSSVIPRLDHVAVSRSRALLAPLLFVLLLQQTIPAAGQTGTNVPPPGSNLYYGQKFNPSMAIIMVVLVAVFFLMGFLSVYIRQCAASRFNADNNIHGEGTFLFGRGSLRGAARGLDSSIMDTFPTFEYSSVKGLKIGKGSLECAVCLNEFEDNNVLRLLPRCNHVFHSNCIDIWLSSHTTCPVCRDNLVPKPGETFEPIVLDISGQEPTLPSGITSDQVCVLVHDEPDKNLDTKQSNLDDRRVPPRSRSTGMRFTRLFAFPRSHSTGHSLVQPGANHERFTLRLPEEIRDEIMRSASLKRATSCATAFPRARSARTGFRRSDSNSGGRSIRGKSYFDYERFYQDDERASQQGCSMTPPFIRRASSVRSARDQDIGMTPPSSRPERSPPLNWLLIRKNGDQGERSSDSLRPPDNQV